jgi:hypothetical protein
MIPFNTVWSLIFPRIPALLRTSTEKNTIKSLKNDIKHLNCKLAELQALLEVKEAEISQLRRLSYLFQVQNFFTYECLHRFCNWYMDPFRNYYFGYWMGMGKLSVKYPNTNLPLSACCMKTNIA